MSDFNSSNLWGIDLGGTKIEGVILKSSGDSKVIFRQRISTEAEHGYDHIVQQIKKLVDAMRSEAGYSPRAIGFGTPGAMVPSTGLMKNCNTTALNGKPLRSDLEKLLNVEVSIANDANCFVLAETRLGVVRDKFPKAKVVFGVIMGTGVGGGLVINGQVINGLHGIGGEWGHNFLDESGGPCYCGKSGCVEKVISGPALENFFEQQTGEKKKLKEIMDLYEKGDHSAQKTMHRLIEKFGLALSVIVNILDPDVIVIGGGVGNIDLLYTDGIAAIGNYIFNDSFYTPVVRPSLGDSAGVFGAAYLTVQS